MLADEGVVFVTRRSVIHNCVIDPADTAAGEEMYACGELLLMRSRLLLIVASVLVFATTLAILMRQQNADERQSDSAATRVSAETKPLAQTSTAQSSYASGIQPQPARRAATASPPPVSTEPVEGPPPELPVILNVPVSHEKAFLRNLSDQALEVRVTASNPASRNQSSVLVTVPGGGRANLTEQGLVFAPGDEIRMSSPPYTDLSVRVN